MCPRADQRGGALTDNSRTAADIAAGLRQERRGRVQVLVMDRPQVRNSLVATTSVALDAALTAPDGDDPVGAVVLTGSSPRAPNRMSSPG